MVAINTLDGVFTAYLVNRGFATEDNPIMAYMLNLGMWHFLFVKLVLINLFSWYCGNHKRLAVRLPVAIFSLLYFWYVVEQIAILWEAYARNLL